MAINFPDAPSTGDEFTSGDRTWKWDGITWETVGAGFTATSPVVLTGADFSFDSTSIETNATDIATNVTDIQTNADAIASLEVADITDLTATAAELNFSDGVTSAIQTQVDAQIPKSTVTTAGDLIVADGASSVTRLGVGADDQILTVVDGAPTWADAGGGGLVWVELFNGAATGGVASQTITGLGGYDNYAIVHRLTSDVNPVTYSMKINGDATANGAGQETVIDANGISQYAGITSIPLGVVSMNYQASRGFLSLRGASSTSVAELTYNSGASSFGLASRGFNGGLMVTKNSEPLTSITFELSGGTIYDGTITIWGA
jgi:hypothetical protein